MSGADLDGIPATKEGAQFNLELGFEPSRGWINIADNRVDDLKFDKEGRDLNFYADDGGGRIHFGNLFIESVEDAGPGISKVCLVDSRILWRRRYATKAYNIFQDNKRDFHLKTTKDGTVSRPWTFREIVEDLVNVLKTPAAGYFTPAVLMDTGILDKVDSSSAPLITDLPLEFVPAGEALARVLSIAGGVIGTDNNGAIVIIMPGEDKWGASEKEVTSRIRSRTFPASENVALQKPKYVKVHYKILREKLFKNTYWTPVMKHDGKDASGNLAFPEKAGGWFTCSQVLSDWGISETTVQEAFFALGEILGKKGDATNAAHLSAIRSGYWRHFRYTAPSTTTEESRCQILPLQADGGYVSPMSNETWDYPPYLKDTKTWLPPQVPGEKALVEGYLAPDAVRVADAKQGVVSIDAEYPVGIYKETGDGKVEQDFSISGNSQIQIVVPFLKKFQSSSGLSQDYYTAGGANGFSDVQPFSPTDKDDGTTAEFLDDSACYIEQDLTGSGSYTALNESDIDDRAEAWAKDYFSGFGQHRSYDITARGYFPSITRPCSRLRSMTVFADGSSAYGTTFRIDNDQPINPASRNYVEGIGQAMRGDTISTAGPQFRRVAGRYNSGIVKKTGRNYEGLMEHRTDQGIRDSSPNRDRPAGWINPAKVGISVAEDRANVTVDHRAKHARITVHDGKRAGYEKVGKDDLCFNYGSKQWEAVLVTPSGAIKDPAAQTPQTTPTGGAASTTPNPGGYLTQSQPAKPPVGQPARSPAGGAQSVHIWTDSPEDNAGAAKGPLRDVLMVGEHRPTGKDPDKYQICKAEVDKQYNLHKTDAECGPTIDGGTAIQPRARGVWQYAEQIYDPIKKGWVHRACVDVASIPPPEGGPPSGGGVPPTRPPGPVPTGGPPDGGGGPGGGGDGAVGGGPSGGGYPGPPSAPGDPISGENIHDNPFAKDPANWPPPEAPAPTGGGGMWGPGLPPWVPGGDDGGKILPHDPGIDAWPCMTYQMIESPGPAIGCGSVETPRQYGDVRGTTPMPGATRPRIGMVTGDRVDLAYGWRNGIGLGGGDSQFASSSDGRSNVMVGNQSTVDRWSNMIWTPGGSKRFDPLFPGSALRPGSLHDLRGGAPEFPGTAPVCQVDAGRFSVDPGPSSPIDWSAATLAAVQSSQTDYESRTVGMSTVALYSAVNDCASRIAALDNRSRDNFNYKSSALMTVGNSTVDYTTAYPYAAQPNFALTPLLDTSAPGQGVILGISACSQNANGTWTATISSNLSAPIAGWPIGIDVKGAVAASVNID